MYNEGRRGSPEGVEGGVRSPRPVPCGLQSEGTQLEAPSPSHTSTLGPKSDLQGVDTPSQHQHELERAQSHGTMGF